jgi:hypothetical protein
MTYQNYMDYTNKSPDYSDHTNWNGSAWVTNYRDHQNYTRDDGVDPPTGDRSYVYDINTPADAFTKDAYIKDQIANIKTLRDDITELPTRKVTSTGGTDTPDPANSYNLDTDFEIDDKALQQQVEETISNVKALWQSIKGDTDNDWAGWPASDQDGQTRKASDYNTLRDKLQDLAQTAKPIAYTDHTNTGTP